MDIRQVTSGKVIGEKGGLPRVIDRQGISLLTTTIFVKYNYQEIDRANKKLINVSITCLPNGMLQDQYNPDAGDSIWLAGRNAPSRGEVFRVRIGLEILKKKANWRVQYIQLSPTVAFSWED